MSQIRSFNVCTFCGGWWESTAEKNPAPVDYIYWFFLEEHSHCPRPTEEANVQCSVRRIRESDPECKRLDPAKEWKPQESPAYHPPVTPSATRSENVSQEDFVGLWTTLNPFNEDKCCEAWRFDKGGTGTVGVFSIACCEFKFSWQFLHPELITLTLEVEQPDPPLDYFFSGKGAVAIEDRINARGERSRVLFIQRSSHKVVQLLRQPQSFWQDWKDKWKPK